MSSCLRRQTIPCAGATFTLGAGGGLYVGPGSRRQIASDGARDPVWRGDGKEILCRDNKDAALISLTVEWNAALKFGAPRKLFS